jgi:hypothetical protein
VTALKRAHLHLTLLGEMWDGNPKLVSFFRGGRKAFHGVDTGVDTLFDFRCVTPCATFPPSTSP